MENFGDRDWVYHRQIAQMWGLMTLRLATSLIVPFNATAYTRKLTGYVDSLESSLLDIMAGNAEEASKHVDLRPLKTAIRRLSEYARRLDTKAEDLRRKPKHQKCYFKIFCFSRFRATEIKGVNKAYLKFERMFIGRGLPGRPIYKHVIYAPGLWEGYAGQTLPSLREALSEGRWDDAGEQVLEISCLLENAISREAF